jgi:hypothetical protein
MSLISIIGEPPREAAPGPSERLFRRSRSIDRSITIGCGAPARRAPALTCEPFSTID